MIEIGRIFTPYDTKFGAPKQGGLVQKDVSRIKLSKEFSINSVKGLKEGMFLWILWEFHQCEGKSKELVRPPKLGGNEKLGVFATRSPFRPNNIAMSLLKYLGVENNSGYVELLVQGADMVSNTPVLDVKPYHPKADVPWEEIPKAWFEQEADQRKKVIFKGRFDINNEFKQLIVEVLELDPRPAYHNDPNRTYVNYLEGKSIHWIVADDVIEVLKVEDTND